MAQHGLIRYEPRPSMGPDPTRHEARPTWVMSRLCQLSLYILLYIHGRCPPLGYALLALWLLVLFYLLGNAASHHFCTSVEPVEGAEAIIDHSRGYTPVAGKWLARRVCEHRLVLVWLGGGGLSSVLGGAFFVSCVVVGIIHISTGSSNSSSSSRAAHIDRARRLLLGARPLLPARHPPHWPRKVRGPQHPKPRRRGAPSTRVHHQRIPSKS